MYSCARGRCRPLHTIRRWDRCERSCAAQCACGFTELDDEQVTDHLHQVFELADGRGNDGLVHAESGRLTCSCGLVAGAVGELDAHLLQAFTPADAIGRDGKKHEAVDGG
jgi:hypothetical protein